MMESKSTMSAIVRIPLHSRKFPGLFALVDECDAELVAPFRWNVMPSRSTFYAAVMKNTSRRTGRTTITTRMHRLILNAPVGTQVDHIDGNGLNNTRANLRLCSQADNLMNKARYANNPTGFTGVTIYKPNGKFIGTIRIRSKAIHLGYFDTAVEAALAFDEAARRYRGSFARLNFPREGEQAA